MTDLGAADSVTHSTTDGELAQIAEKLTPKFTGENGPLSDHDVEEAIRDSADELRDAPVQTFVPIITENKARNRLQEEADEQSRDVK
jgi:hypothetical protein